MATTDETQSQATADPLVRRGDDPADAPIAAVSVLFHSDLRRIGQFHELAPGASTVIGRTEPVFVGPGAAARPLLDPCVSRRQLGVTWRASENVFELTTEAGARREVALVTESGELAPLPAEVPPGAMVAIGDRLMIGVGLRSRRASELPELVGHSEVMRALRDRIDALAASDETVLVTGETGTGKELVARALHQRSARRDHPFVPLNCAALPETLLEAELFGHERGAFTGAVTAREGLFRAAEAGTLFLDEVADLTPAAQAKLLRALQERTVRTVGREVERSVDVRVIAATNQSLMQAVRAGRFRLDLLTRLEGLSIRVPSLAERRSDIPELFCHFLRKALEARGRAEPPWLVRDVNLFAPPVPFDFWRSLIGRHWIGNVRQLERAAIATATLSLARSAFVAPELDPEAERNPEPSGAVAQRRRPARAELEQALEQHDWVQHRVARALDIPQATLSRWITEDGILRPSELERSAVEAALEGAAGDLNAAASALRVSARGLRLRIGELGLQDRLTKKRTPRG